MTANTASWAVAISDTFCVMFSPNWSSANAVRSAVGSDPMIRTEDHDGIAIVTIEHGKVNALDTELLLALRDAFASSSQHRAVVLTGAGRAFSAGIDLRSFIEGGRDHAEAFFHALEGALVTAFTCPVPVVAAVNGHAIAGGCVLAATADVRVMSAGTIGLPELQVGVPFPAATIEIMRHLLGTSLSPIVYGARNYEPDAAAAHGLVDEVCDPEELIPAARARAEHLASVVPTTFAAVKAALRAPAAERIRSAGGDAAAMAELWTRDDTLEAAGRVLAR